MKASRSVVSVFTAVRPAKTLRWNTTITPRPALWGAAATVAASSRLRGTVPTQIAGSAHGAGKSDRHLPVQRSVQQVGRLLQRIGAVGDDDPPHLARFGDLL